MFITDVNLISIFAVGVFTGVLATFWIGDKVFKVDKNKSKLNTKKNYDD